MINRLFTALRRRWLRPRRAQSLVEFALVVGPLLLIIFCGINALQLLLTRQAITQAAVVAANRAALVGGDDREINRGDVVRAAEQVLDSGTITRASEATITVACAAQCRRYDPITVNIAYAGQYWVPLGPFTTLSLRAAVTRASEQDRVASTLPTPTLRPSQPTPTFVPSPTPVPNPAEVVLAITIDPAAPAMGSDYAIR